MDEDPRPGRFFLTGSNQPMIRFCPPLYDGPFVASDWMVQYVQTYLERDLSDLAREADVSHTTVRQWISILEASWIVLLVQPWRENYNKRLTRSPTLHPLRGALFENLAVAELAKHAALVTGKTHCSFWYGRGSVVVGLLLTTPAGLEAWEIKSGATFTPN